MTSYRAQLFIDEAPTIKSLYDYSDFVITIARRALQRQPELGKITVSVGLKPTDEKQKPHGKAGAAPSYSKTITCYNCGKVGHISPDCPQKRKESTTSAKATPAARDASKIESERKDCGLRNHDAKDCHHRTAQCSSCHKIGHESRICRSSGSNNRNKSSDSTDKKEGGAKKAHKAAAASDAAEKQKGGKSKGKGRPGTAKSATKTAAVAAAMAGAATTQALVLEHQVMMEGTPLCAAAGDLNECYTSLRPKGPREIYYIDGSEDVLVATINHVSRTPELTADVATADGVTETTITVDTGATRGLRGTRHASLGIVRPSAWKAATAGGVVKSVDKVVIE